MSTPGQDPEYILSTGTERVVFQLLAAEEGRDALTEREISPGRIEIRHTQPADYAAGVAAARRVEGRARQLVHDYARKARGEGVSWRDLVEPLGVYVEPDSYEDPAVAAFEMIAPTPSQRFDARSVYWRCASCGEGVTDKGPYNGHPDDDETGHAETCERHRAEVAAYMRRQGLDEEGDA
jgi:hypothetical protein